MYRNVHRTNELSDRKLREDLIEEILSPVRKRLVNVGLEIGRRTVSQQWVNIQQRKPITFFYPF